MRVPMRAPRVCEDLRKERKPWTHMRHTGWQRGTPPEVRVLQRRWTSSCLEKVSYESELESGDIL